MDQDFRELRTFIVQRFAFLTALAAVPFMVAPAFAEEFDAEERPNPGFTLELLAGSAAAGVVVRIRNDSSATQSIYRAFPTADNHFDVRDVDEDQPRPRRLEAPAAFGRVISTGTALEPGQTYDARVDLNTLFALTAGHRYRVKASTRLRFGPSDRAVVTKLHAKELVITA